MVMNCIGNKSKIGTASLLRSEHVSWDLTEHSKKWELEIGSFESRNEPEVFEEQKSPMAGDGERGQEREAIRAEGSSAGSGPF